MLASQPIIAFIPTRDAALARTFYEGILGLRFVQDDHFALVMEASGTMIRIVRVGDFTPFPFTILGWQVTDIEQSVTGLITKGLAFKHYNLPGQSDAGIWTAPDGAKVAWFNDPDGNTLSISQHTQPAAGN